MKINLLNLFFWIRALFKLKSPLNDLSKLNLSPVRDLDNVYFINTSEELRVLISNDINIVPKDQNFNYFYLDNGFSGWKKLLQIDDIKPNIVNK